MACQYRARTLLYIGLQRPISIGCRPIVTVMLYTLHTRFIIVGLYYMNTVGVKTFDSGQRGQGRRHEFEGKGGGVSMHWKVGGQYSKNTKCLTRWGMTPPRSYGAPPLNARLIWFRAEYRQIYPLQVANNELSEVFDILLRVTIYSNPSTRLDNVRNFWWFVISLQVAQLGAFAFPCRSPSTLNLP